VIVGVAREAGASAGIKRVTIVMITWNRRANVLATLPRLLALPEHPPIIVVDNGSADGTAEAITDRFPSVTVVALDENRGAAGRNAGAELAATPYVAFSDDDSWWEPGALCRAADVLDGHPRLALVAATVILGDGGPPDPTVELMRRSSLVAEPDLPGPPVLGFIACGAVVNRKAFLGVGGFNPLLGVGGEEWLVAVDLAEAGWGLAHVADVVAVHQPSALRDRHHRRRQLVRNKLWSTWLRRPWPAALRTTITTMADAARDGPAREGLVEALRGASSVLRSRRPISVDVDARLRLLERSARPSRRQGGR
jgi:N-acetylglucosaminyl-diphospho-decaprenol L-rhamnosyltransferase